MCSVRSSPTDEWTSARWKLIKVDVDAGETTFAQWMVKQLVEKAVDPV